MLRNIMNAKCLFILLLGNILISCSSPPNGFWFKKEATQEEKDQTNYICLQESKRLVTRNHTYQYTPPNPNPITLNQKNENALIQGFHQGFNSNNSTFSEFDNTLYEACMKARGFNYYYIKPEHVSQKKWDAYLKRNNMID